MSSTSVGFDIKNITTQEFFDFHYKESCTLATTGALTLASDFNTGDTLDSVTLVLGDRILIKDQADASENGIYTVNNSGAPTRAVDFDNPSEVTKGAYVSVVHGSTNNNTSYVMSTNAVPTVIGTTQLTFTNISSATIADEAVTLAKMAHAPANTVLVRDANSTGDPSYNAVANTQILIGDGTGFTAAALSGDAKMTNGGAVTIEDDAVTYAKMQNLATGNRVLGSSSSGLIGEVQIATDMIADDAVTYAKMQNLATGNRVLGSSSSGLIGEVQIVEDMISDGAVDLSTKVTGSLPVANGGTGGTSKTTGATGLGLGTSDNVRFNSLGVGTAASTSTAGTIRATNDITAFFSSDKRLKDNITKIEDPLKKLEKINGYTFDWIPKENIHSNEGKDIGVIAQEIEEVMPEITTTRENGYKAVKYEKIVPLLIECIKEQQIQIDELKNK